LGITQVVAHELEREQVARVRDRKDAVEHFLQALVPAFGRRQVHLEEVTEGLQLDVEQVRDLDVPLPLGLAVAPPLLHLLRLQTNPPFRQTFTGRSRPPRSACVSGAPGDVRNSPRATPRPRPMDRDYLTSTVAPTSSRRALASPASCLE